MHRAPFTLPIAPVAEARMLLQRGDAVGVGFFEACEFVGGGGGGGGFLEARVAAGLIFFVEGYAAED